MFSRMLKKDLSRNKTVSVTLFIFILLAALLVSSGVRVIMELSGASDSLFEKAVVPDFVQMAAEKPDQKQIDNFAESNPLVKWQQTVEMLNINGASLTIGTGTINEAGSIIEASLVKQNIAFDFLLDMDNQIMQVADGEIGLPVYYMAQNNMQIGDEVRVVSGGTTMVFTVKGFVRDAQMNPSIITSKRLLISDGDFEAIKNTGGKTEFLIEFLLFDREATSVFEQSYQASGLPQKDTALTYSLYKTMNGLTDGMMIAVMLLISLLLIGIAGLCLRFTLLATIEEDYREIGMMKAVGVASKGIRRLYLAKYILLASIASIAGYLLSMPVSRLFSSNIARYMGASDKTLASYVIPLLGAGLVFAFVVVYCQIILRKFKKVSAVEAIRTGGAPQSGVARNRMLLHKNRQTAVNLFLGMKEVLGGFKSYGILCFVFILCSFLMVMLLSFLSTMDSPEFITYMGAGKSDIRIDLVQSGDDIASRYQAMSEAIRADSEIEKSALLVTSIFQVKTDTGVENIKVEIGDFSVFPLSYSSGAAPEKENEIALSVMNAESLEKKTGDEITLLIDGQEQVLTVCGLYQDVTNGGKTAKAALPYESSDILWYIVNIDVKAGVNIDDKVNEYEQLFAPAKVTSIANYTAQTLGNTIDQLKLVTIAALLLSVSIAVLITFLFLRLMIARDNAQIKILRSIGFSKWNLQVQYITRMLLVLFIGIVAGTILSGTLGQSLAGVLGSFMGAPTIQFVVNPVIIYILCPLVLIITVALATITGSKNVFKPNDSIIAE